MLRSMLSAVTGLRSHQEMMDVIGNNIANVNSPGFKSSSVIFEDLLSQMVSGASVPTGNAGGVAPQQVGLGVRVAQIAQSFSQGALQLTGNATDVAIQGDGFFVVRQPNETEYTRAGAFSFDALGRLVSQSGGIVQGWLADTNGTINTNGVPVDLTMPVGQTMPPKTTENVRLSGNLDSAAAADTTVSTGMTVYDVQGKRYDVTVTLTKSADNQWDLTAQADTDGDGTPNDLTVSGGPLTFDPSTGQMTSGAITVDMGTAGFAAPINLDFGTPGTPDAVTQFAGSTALTAVSQDGAPMGTLQSFSIGQDGVVSGVFSNGHTRPVAMLALANFANPAGLEKAGGNSYRTTVDSGTPIIGSAGTSGIGTIAAGSLEMSNVDLAKEFTNLIVAQRGFQANSRVITASDELLQDLVNLKR